MRKEFLCGLADLADIDERIVLLTADLGFGSIEVFSSRHPKRFINVGVSEQSMIGVATGLAESGLIPYCYSIAAFSVARTFEFLRNGPIAHGLPVRLVGIGPGMDYSQDGHTHFALEDIGLLLGQPRTLLICPRDSNSAEGLGRRGSEFPGLVYYRLARTGLPVEQQSVGLGSRSSCLMLSIGDASSVGQKLLRQMGRDDVNILYIEEFSVELIAQLAAEILHSGTEVIAILENHYISGGFGTYLADALMSVGWKGTLHKWGVSKEPFDGLGDYEYMVEEYCETLESFASKISISLERRTG